MEFIDIPSGQPDDPETDGDESVMMSFPAYKYDNGEVVYGTIAHTNEMVRLYGTGARIDEMDVYKGAAYPDTDIIDNTNIHDFIKDVTDLE